MQRKNRIETPRVPVAESFRVTIMEDGHAESRTHGLEHYEPIRPGDAELEEQGVRDEGDGG